jgi:hypothetical protein
MIRFTRLALLALAACGGSAATRSAPPTTAISTPTAPPSPTSTSTPTPTPTATPTLPTACADASSSVCVPPADFVERLCAKANQDVALSLFAKRTPFTRLCLRGKVDELAFGEEVLALRFHAQQQGGMIVGSGNGSYDVLRWDGSCSRGVEAEMVARSCPSRPKTARIKWHRMDSQTQDALIAASDRVKRARATRGKECQGAMTGDVSAACEKADQALGDAIVDCVRAGGDRP